MSRLWGGQERLRKDRIEDKIPKIKQGGEPMSKLLASKKRVCQRRKSKGFMMFTLLSSESHLRNQEVKPHLSLPPKGMIECLSRGVLLEEIVL